MSASPRCQNTWAAPTGRRRWVRCRRVARELWHGLSVCRDCFQASWDREERLAAAARERWVVEEKEGRGRSWCVDAPSRLEALRTIHREQPDHAPIKVVDGPGMFRGPSPSGRS